MSQSVPPPERGVAHGTGAVGVGASTESARASRGRRIPAWLAALAIGLVMGLLVGVANGASVRARTPATTDGPASAAAIEWAEAEFGSFEPVTVHGRGDAEVDLPAAAGIVSVSYGGTDDFNVVVVDERGDSTFDGYLVSAVGAYSGHTAYGLASRDAARLEVTVDDGRAWNLTIAPLVSAPGFTESGTGDAVLLYDGDAATLEANHGGEDVFLVRERHDGADRPSLLFNESAVSGVEAPLSAGPSVVVVEASGDWTLSVR